MFARIRLKTKNSFEVDQEHLMSKFHGRAQNEPTRLCINGINHLYFVLFVYPTNHNKPFNISKNGK